MGFEPTERLHVQLLSRELRSTALAIFRNWSEYEDLNLGPLRPKRNALPGCAILRIGKGERIRTANFGFGIQRVTINTTPL